MIYSFEQSILFTGFIFESAKTTRIIERIINMFLGFTFVFIGLVILFAVIGVPILIGYFVYKDADKRVDTIPILWALLSALAPFYIGLVIYLIVRKDYPLKSEYGRYNEYRSYNNYNNQDYTSQNYNSEEYQNQDSDQSGSSYTYEYAEGYKQQPEHKKMPGWGKALLIIGIIVCVVLAISFFVNLFNFFTWNFNYSSLYPMCSLFF